MNWTDAQSATLQREWLAGTDAGEIGRKLGGVSPGAVRRRRIRMGLPDRSDDARHALNVERGRALSDPKRHGRPKGAASPQRMSPLPGSTPRPWLQREPGECAFPVLAFGGELTGEAISCCLPVERPGCSYCEGHNAIRFGRPWPPADAPRELAGAQYV